MMNPLFHRTKAEHDLQKEMDFHLAQETDANIRAGLAPEEARLAALRSFGGVAQVQEECRDAWGVRFFDDLRQDLTYGLRGLRRNPGFALIVVLTLGLGIGANTAIFSVVHGVLLRELPYATPGRLFQIEQSSRNTGAHSNTFGFSYLDLEDYRARTHSFTGLAEYHSMWFILLGRPEPERVQTGVVSANYFGLLGVKPIFGRDFTPEDNQPGAPAVLMLSNEYWQRSFGGDPAVVGQVFQMNDRPHTVIGVLPPLPAFPNRDNVFMPTVACPFRGSDAARTQRPFRIIANVIGRLADNTTPELARADLRRVATELCGDLPNEYQADTGYTAEMTSLREAFTGQARTPLFVLLATAGFVLLIACANVANLTLARLVQRDRELAVRAAMGAGRARIFRQLLTENILLSTLGGLAGLALATGGLKLLVQYTGRFLPNTDEITLNVPVLLFTLAVSILTGLFFGSRPALPATEKLVDALKEGARGTAGGRSRLRALLVVVQVAVSVPLLVGAGLAARSVVNLQHADPGIRTDKVISANINLNFTRYDTPEKRVDFWQRAIATVATIPAAQSVGLTAQEPLNGLVNFLQPFVIQGRPAPAPNAPASQSSITVVNETYFSTVGQPLLLGRFFNSVDNPKGRPTVIINQSLASHYWPNANPIDQHISFDNGQTWVTVVGIVANVRQQLDHDAVDEIYTALLRAQNLTASIVVRTAGDPAALSRDLREALRKADPQQPVTRIQTMAQTRGAALLPYRLTAMLLGLFALLALVITLAGIGGVLAFSVSQRTQEIGIRMALGASRGDVLWMVLRQGLVLVGAGLAAGTVAAVLLSQLMATVLYGVDSNDPLTYLTVVAMLLGVAALACLLPARRATAINPMIALRAT